VHDGFARALEVVWKELSKTLERLSSRPVWFTGHSLGAALATLAAFRFKAASGVCTIGSPLVGNGDFVAAFNGKLAQASLRYVNNRDIVTHLPPAALAAPRGRYEHVNTLRWMAPDGSVQPASAGPTGLFDRVFDSRRAFVPLQMDIANLTWLNLPDALRDHTPLRYVIDIWNDFAKSA
jgi:triacylglycerol lipase